MSSTLTPTAPNSGITLAGLGGMPMTGGTFTGATFGPTAARGQNTTQHATSAFVALHSHIPNILDFGGDNTGATDNTAAFAACAASGPSSRAGVYFPPGTYLFTQRVQYTLPGDNCAISIIGAGQETTRLLWPNGEGMKLTTWTATHPNFNNSFVLEGLSFLTGKSDGTGSGLVLLNPSQVGYANQSQNKLSHLMFRGSDGPTGANYWGSGIIDTGVWGLNAQDVFVAGTPSYQGIGIQIQGNGWACCGHNLTRISLPYLNNGLVIGGYVQGVNLSASNMLANYGVLVPLSGNNTGHDQLILNQVQIQSPGIGVYIQTNFTNVIICGCYFIQGIGGSSPATGVYLTSATGFACQACCFNQDSTGANIGITLGGSSASYSSVITGCNFINQTGNPINLLSSSVRVNVQSNTYYGSAGIANAGTGNTIGGGSA